MMTTLPSTSNADRFWLVWSPTGIRPPSFRHPTHNAAETEARRLAHLHPGKEFFVLAADFSVVASSEHHTVFVDRDEIPF